MDIEFIPVSNLLGMQGVSDVFRVFIRRDNWNDYGFQTSCDIYLMPPGKAEVEKIGETRIAFKGQKPSDPWVFDDDMKPFESLKNRAKEYCSVSTSLKYYENLRAVGEEFALEFLTRICDAAFDMEIWDDFKGEEVFETSLLRSRSSVLRVRDELPASFGNQAGIVSKFQYSVTLPGADAPHDAHFDFSFDPLFPYRVNLLAGGNGTGKTQVLSRIALALTGFVGKASDERRAGVRAAKRQQIMEAGVFSIAPSFYGVLAVSFSAFDDFEIPAGTRRQQSGAYSEFNYAYCGLRTEDGVLKDAPQLLREMRALVQEADPHRIEELEEFLQDHLPNIDPSFLFGVGRKQRSIYNSLSAGQRIVLNILVNLLVRLEKRMVVLLDEPETHLHPLLMSTLISGINAILQKRDAYAIISSHSPIVAQQIPSRRIQIFRRAGTMPIVSKPDRECFGENLSVITSTLFDAVEGERDYTEVIDQALDDPVQLELLLGRRDELGVNARMYLASRLQER